MSRARKINPARALVIEQITLPELDRLRAKVLCNPPPERAKVKGDCWIWQGYRDGKGYGQVSFRGRMQWVHRVFYSVYRQSLPELMQVDHLCRNPSCCNPWHLRKTSHSTNYGEANSRRAKATREEVAPF